MSVTDRLQCDFPADWVADFSQCLFEWQSLAGGILALAAAAASLFFLNRQIRQDEAHHKSELARRHLAQRAVLSLVLSQICQASLNAIKKLATIRQQAEIARVLATPEAPSLTLSNELIQPLKEFLETTENRDLVGIVTELVTRIQVTRSRLGDMRTDRDHDVEARMLDLGQVHAVSECLFDYARFEADKPPRSVSWNRVRAALNFAGARSETHAGVHELLEGYAARSKDFLVLP